MNTPTEGHYEFGPFRIDAIKRLLLRESELVPLTPKAFDLLLALVENRGRVIEKDELMNKVWAGTVVEESNIAHHISALRKALDDNHGKRRYIVTVPGRGYSFVADMRPMEVEGADLLVAKRTSSRIVIEEVVNGEDWPRRVLEQEAPDKESLLISTPPGAEPLARSFVIKTVSHKRSAAILLGVVTIGALVSIFVLSRFADRGGQQSKQAVAFQKMEITKLTHTGNAAGPAISPDGKYVAYVLVEAGRLGIWLRHLDTGSARQILPPVEVRHLGALAFSRDGSHIYFVKSEGFTRLNVLYRMPVLGGVPTKLIPDLDALALSPDGARLAFVRNSRNLGESALMIANADGTQEYKLATRRWSDPYVGLTWSPDGKAIACSVGSTEGSGRRMYPVDVRVEDGTQKEITAQRWQFLQTVVWLSDGSGLIVTGRDKGTMTGWLWHISYPGGEVRRLTDDTDTYTGLSMTPDSKALVTSRLDLRTNIWTAPIGNGASSLASHAKQITTGASNNLVYRWLPNGRILFTSSANSLLGQDIWEMNADGTNQTQLTTTDVNAYPSTSPDGRYIIFSSDRTGRLNLWKIESDGSNPKQLTHGSGEDFPDCSPDGKWVVYTSVDDETLWKMSLEGSEPQQLTGSYWKRPVISPDGKWIAAFNQGPEPDAQYRIGVIPFEGGAPLRMFDIPPDIHPYQRMQWTPDGRALTYPGKRDGICNLWSQPIDGGEPMQLTGFKSNDQIFSFDWSADGNQLVFSRGDWTFDIVLIRNIQ
jgi:Tol biopolymer transport system component/DNA-binding winged helix-turn-helix (wHTH) protein